MQNQQPTQREQCIIEHIKDTWQNAQIISPNDLQKITEFVSGLPEQYKQMAFAKIAEYAMSSMNLHLLNLMALFQQNADQEEISLENVKSTFDHILSETFQTLSTLSKNIQVQSFDDVATLINITINLQTLSQARTAEDAQSWLYELPTMYYSQLSQENLVGNKKQIQIIQMETHQVRTSANWTSQNIKGYTSSEIKTSYIPHPKKTGVA